MRLQVIWIIVSPDLSSFSGRLSAFLIASDQIGFVCTDVLNPSAGHAAEMEQHRLALQAFIPSDIVDGVT